MIKELKRKITRYKLRNTCLYCDNSYGEYAHFSSGCCGRGMCDECYNGLVGTMEQLQLDHTDDEDFAKIKKEYQDEAYLCFECDDIWRAKMSGKNCFKCNNELQIETDKQLKKEYTYYCAVCDENMYSFEVLTN